MIGDGDLMMDAYVTQIGPRAIANKKAYKIILSVKIRRVLVQVQVAPFFPNLINALKLMIQWREILMSSRLLAY